MHKDIGRLDKETELIVLVAASGRSKQFFVKIAMANTVTDLFRLKHLEMLCMKLSG